MTKSFSRTDHGQFGPALFASALLHIAFVALYFGFSSAKPVINLDRTTVNVHLAKLGKKRDEKLLPRFDASEMPKEMPKPKPPENSKPLAENLPKQVIKAPAAKKEVPPNKVKEAPKKAKSASPLDLLKKRFGKPSEEGVDKGSAFGSSLNAELQDSYAAQVGELISQNYELPDVLRHERNNLAVFVRLKIDAKGELIKAEILKSSGRAIFDSAVLVGVKKISSFGAPPLQLRRTFATDGLELEFRP